MPSKVDLRQLAVERSRETKPDAGPKRQFLTRYVIPAGLLLGFLGVAAWAARDWYLPRRQVTVIPVFATRAAVQQEGAPLFKAAGWVEPRPIPIRVPALASGVVEKLLVVEDDPVKKGEVVAHLIDEDAKYLLDKAKARLDLATADLATAEAERDAAETNLKFPVHLEAVAAAAKADVAKVETALAKLPFAIIEAEAIRKFHEQDLHSKQLAGEVVAAVELDRARSKLDAAQAKVGDLRKQLESLDHEKIALHRRHLALVKKLELLADEKRDFKRAKANVAAAKARLNEAGVVVAEAELRLARMKVAAPVSGRVLHLLAAPGTHVAISGGHSSMTDPSSVITMYEPDNLQIRVDVRFDDLPLIRQDQPVRIESPALAKPLIGKVLFVSSFADKQKNTLEVKVALDAPPALLKPEMLVDATFLAPKQTQKGEPSQEQRLFVPNQLIGNDEKGKFVWIADTFTGIARKRPVDVGGATANGLVEITKGLTLSSRLIVGGREGLQDGSRIRVTGEDATLGVDNSN